MPFDWKGFLILDPSSHTGILDVHLDHMTVFFGYERWVESAMNEQSALGHFDSVTWLKGLSKEAKYDGEEARIEEYNVDNEERVKRGLSRTDGS